MGTVILNCLPIFFSGNSYLTYVFLLLFAFGCLFRLFGFSNTWRKYVKFER